MRGLRVKQTANAIKSSLRGYALKGSGMLLAAAITLATYTGNAAAFGCTVDIENCVGQYSALTNKEQRTNFRRGSYFVRANGKLVASGMCAALDNKLTGYAVEAQAIYDKARYNSIGITEDMVDISNGLGVELQGLENSVKTASSVINKIERKMDKDINNGELVKKDSEYVADMGDLVRFTQIGQHDKMAENTIKTIEALEKRGYTINEVDNKYLNRDGRYKAIHINAVSPNGQTFEVQIHSDKSLEANKATHGMYEEWRNPETSQDRKAELFTEIKAVYDALPLPKDIEKVANRKL